MRAIPLTLFPPALISPYPGVIARYNTGICPSTGVYKGGVLSQ